MCDRFIPVRKFLRKDKKNINIFFHFFPETLCETRDTRHREKKPNKFIRDLLTVFQSTCVIFKNGFVFYAISNFGFQNPNPVFTLWRCVNFILEPFVKKMLRNLKNMKRTPEKLAQAIEMYDKNESTYAIAEFFGVTPGTIADWLLRQGVTLRVRGAHWKRQARYKDHNAHSKVQKALRQGTLKRPESCEACLTPWDKASPKTKPLAHHDDYNKPLEVRWLCTKCHYVWHESNTPILHPNKGRSRRVGRARDAHK